MAYIVPTYGHFDYARTAVLSALRCTAGGYCPRVYLIDDGSEGWHAACDKELAGLLARSDVVAYSFPENGGLTRSWNQGLAMALSDAADYICCTNSDVLFASNWHLGAIDALSQFTLVGPVTNAPGTEAAQDVSLYAGWKLTDNQGRIDDLGAVLLAGGAAPVESPINGFCMLARGSCWDAGRFGPNAVFNPYNEFDSKGRRNPTPLMTLNEYELQRRWASKGRKACVAPTSFVFHYRAVTRGEKFKRGNWFRR